MTSQLVFPHLIFDSMFDEWFRSTLPTQRISTGFPVVDHYSDDDGNAVLEFALAGYKAEDLSVSVEGSKLTISSDGAKTSEKNNNRRIARRKFCSSFTDKENLYELSDLQASYVDGILKVVIPKKEAAKPKVFQIETKTKALKS